MSGRRRPYRRYAPRQAPPAARLTAGQEAARRHIQEASAFSEELGGTDKDVKRYFFSLPPPELDELFQAYGSRFGQKPEEYARLTFPKWRSGGTQMSGMVAKRLFDLLPPRMPAQVRLELAGNIWRHFGPSARLEFTVGPQADPIAVMADVGARVAAAVEDYAIPNSVRNRFEWVSGGDVAAKEALLNFFRQQERERALAALELHLPILQEQLRTHGETTGSIKTSIVVHRIEVTMWIDSRLEGSHREGAPRSRHVEGPGLPTPGDASGDKTASSWLILLWMAAAVAALLFIMSFGHHQP